MEQNQDADKRGKDVPYSGVIKTDPYLSDSAGVLHEPNMSLVLRDVQFVDDLVDPLLHQLKVLRTDTLRAIDQKHNICRGVAAG